MVLAKVIVNDRSYIVCETTLLENLECTTLKAIDEQEDVSIKTLECGEILNPTDGFVSDLEKIVAKKNNGDASVYFTGDYGKYYLTDYYKVKDMYDLLQS